MPEPIQTYQNHVRYHAPFHYVFVPLMFINLIWSLVSLIWYPGASSLQGVLIAVLLAVVGFLARINALKAQDRVIRLEEQLRYQRVLSPEGVQRAGALKPGQMIALRFASDEELPNLMQQTLEGRFAKSNDIKLAIQQWRGDYLRV